MKDSKVYSFEDFKRDARVRSFVNGVKETPGKIYRWCTIHPQAAITIATITIPSVAKIAKVIDNNIDRHHEYMMQELRYYDPSTHIWHDLRRKLKSWEKTELATRVANGETRVEILKEFNVLKR